MHSSGLVEVVNIVQELYFQKNSISVVLYNFSGTLISMSLLMLSSFPRIEL